MDEQRVYALTAKGNAELMGASTSLDAPELKLLVLVDGRASVAQIAQSAQLAPQVVAEMLKRLVASGHVVSAADVHFGAIDPGSLFSESEAGVASLRAKGYFVRIARRAPSRGKLAAGQKLTVLVIEDDPQLAKLLRTDLQMEDFACASPPRAMRSTPRCVRSPRPIWCCSTSCCPTSTASTCLAKCASTTW